MSCTCSAILRSALARSYHVCKASLYKRILRVNVMLVKVLNTFPAFNNLQGILWAVLTVRLAINFHFLTGVLCDLVFPPVPIVEIKPPAITSLPNVFDRHVS